MSLPIGAQKRTTDGVIGASGNPIRLYGIIVNADSSGAAVDLYSGTNTGGTKLDTITGTASVSTRVIYPGGLLFANGLFVDVDAHTNYITAIYAQDPA